MIAYVTVGADDISRAKLFYSSFLPELGYVLREENNGDLSYVLPVKPSLVTTLPDFYVKKPFDGQPASTGNGSMVAFQVRSQKEVRDLHAAALDAGGSDEGKPGNRDSYSPNFMLATFGILKETKLRYFLMIQMI